MHGIFSPEGKFYRVTSGILDLVIITLLWIVGCIPIVTILTSTASMYHTTVKCVRYDRGRAFTDFKEAYKKNLKQGVPLTLLFGIIGLVIGYLDYQVFFLSVSRSGGMLILSIGMLVLSIVYLLNLLWIVPVFSRFSNTFGKILQLNYVIATRHIIRSIPMILVVAAAVIFVLASNESIIFVPALVMLLNSYLSEPGLRKYMPKQEEDNGDWRYGFK